MFCFIPAILDAEEIPASSLEKGVAATYYSGDILGTIDLLNKAVPDHTEQIWIGQVRHGAPRVNDLQEMAG